jgi:hypothetical protein
MNVKSDEEKQNPSIIPVFKEKRAEQSTHILRSKLTVGIRHLKALESEYV